MSLIQKQFEDALQLLGEPVLIFNMCNSEGANGLGRELQYDQTFHECSEKSSSACFDTTCEKKGVKEAQLSLSIIKNETSDCIKFQLSPKIHVQNGDFILKITNFLNKSIGDQPLAVPQVSKCYKVIDIDKKVVIDPSQRTGFGGTSKREIVYIVAQGKPAPVMPQSIRNLGFLDQNLASNNQFMFKNSSLYAIPATKIYSFTLGRFLE